jgi:hypothetical protein
VRRGGPLGPLAYGTLIQWNDGDEDRQVVVPVPLADFQELDSEAQVTVTLEPVPLDGGAGVRFAVAPAGEPPLVIVVHQVDYPEVTPHDEVGFTFAAGPETHCWYSDYRSYPHCIFDYVVDRLRVTTGSKVEDIAPGSSVELSSDEGRFRIDYWGGQRWVGDECRGWDLRSCPQCRACLCHRAPSLRVWPIELL